MPIGFTDRQLLALIEAATMIRPEQRDAFLRAIAAAATAQPIERDQPTLDERQDTMIDRHDASVSIGIRIAERESEDYIGVDVGDHGLT